MKSFSTEADDLSAAQSFFQTYGFVVFKDVLSAAECGCLNVLSRCQPVMAEGVGAEKRDSYGGFQKWGYPKMDGL